MAGKPKEFDGASPAKIFVGGLAKDVSLATFKEHFGKYGEITDAVIMKERHTQKPRGFGFITYADPSVVDKVIEDNHAFNGKQVEIKRTIPRGAAPLKDFKTKKIFVGGIPTTLTEDEFKGFFSKFGKVVEHEIIKDHSTSRSRGFGFIVFDAEKTVDELLAKKGNMIDLNGIQVEIKKAEPKKSSNPPPRAFDRETRARPYADGLDRFGSTYGSYGTGGFGPSSYRSPGGLGPRPESFSGGYGGVAGEYSGGYGGYGGGGLGAYRGESSLGGYSSRLGAYGGEFSGGYGGGLGGYGREAGGYGIGGSSYGGTYDSGAGYGGSGGLYSARGGYGGGGGGGPSRYHPYAR